MIRTTVQQLLLPTPVFRSWCAERVSPVSPLPATPATVVLYITALAAKGLKPSTIRRRLASISVAHQVLQAVAQSGNYVAAQRLTNLLIKLGDVEGLRAEVLGATETAAAGLIQLVAGRSPSTADRLRRYGLNADGTIPWETTGNPSPMTG